MKTPLLSLMGITVFGIPAIPVVTKNAPIFNIQKATAFYLQTDSSFKSDVQ